MSFLGDIVADILTSGISSSIGPSTSRGMMILGLVLGLALCGATGWLLITSPDPLREPEWAFGVIVISILIAPMEIILSGVTLKREPEERALAASTLAVNAGALALALAAIL